MTVTGPHPPPSTAIHRHRHRHPHPPPPPPPPWCDRRTDTSRQPDSFFRLLWRREKKQQTNKHEIKKKVTTGRELSAVWRRGWNILRVCFFCFSFLTFILAGGLWRSAISSCHTDENGCVRNENPLWRRNPWHLVLFPFFPPPFFISSPSLLLSARRCGVSAQWDHPSIKRVWAACGGFFPFNFLSMGFFFAGSALSLVCSGVCRCSWTHSSSGYSKQYDTKRPERLVLIYFQLCSLASAFKCPAFTLQFHQKSFFFL